MIHLGYDLSGNVELGDPTPGWRTSLILSLGPICLSKNIVVFQTFREALSG